MTEQTIPRRTGRVGGLLLWFATLGGFVSWSVHLAAAWSMDELTCAAGSEKIAGAPLQLAVGIAAGAPAVVTAAALAMAWHAWRVTARQESHDGARSIQRARLMAVVGLWANSLFLIIIVLGGIAILVFPPCQR